VSVQQIQRNACFSLCNNIKNEKFAPLSMPDTAPASVSNLVIRSAQPQDVPTLFDLINALADYEKLSHCVTGSAEALRNHLFGDRSCIEAIVAEYDGRAVGFALFFTNYSTFLTKPGLYLEDLFVLPDYRSQGIGKALLVRLAQLALDRDYGRLEWSVLDWNEPAIGFYQRLGATVLPDWRICRVTGEAIGQLAMRE
jgi:GNAT superfamily N-acetyltransferase